MEEKINKNPGKSIREVLYLHVLALSVQGSSKPPVKWRWDGSYPYTSYPNLYKVVLYFHSSGKTAEEIERFIIAIRGAEMLVVTFL